MSLFGRFLIAVFISIEPLDWLRISNASSGTRMLFDRIRTGGCGGWINSRELRYPYNNLQCD